MSATLGKGRPLRRCIRGRARSFRFAFRGVALVCRTQSNARIHVACTLIVCLCGGLLRIAIAEWCVILLCIGGVWVAECLNTALEFLADHASPEFSPLVRNAKDAAAGGVLIMSCVAAVVGLLVFIPRVLT